MDDMTTAAQIARHQLPLVANRRQASRRQPRWSRADVVALLRRVAAEVRRQRQGQPAGETHP